jgi:hypothetical protein
MHGTWKVTGGSAGGTALAFAAAAAAVAGVEWVIAWLWLIALVGVSCGVLATVAALRLGACYERRAALATVRWPVQQQLRAGVIPPAAAQVPAAERPAIGPVYNFSFHGADATRAAAIIQHALGGANELGQHGRTPHLGIPDLHPDHRDQGPLSNAITGTAGDATTGKG